MISGLTQSRRDDSDQSNLAFALVHKIERGGRLGRGGRTSKMAQKWHKTVFSGAKKQRKKLRNSLIIKLVGPQGFEP